MPVRSALFGTVLAVAMVVAALTFASGLTILVSHSPLYGWNWNYMFSTSNDVPPESLRALEHDPDVAGWSGVDLTPLQIDGQYVPTLLATTRRKVSPPILSGHGLDANDQIVIGSATLASLHLHIGDSVTVSFANPTESPAYIPPLASRRRYNYPPGHRLLQHHRRSPVDGYGGAGVCRHRAHRVQRAEASPDPLLNGPQYVFVRSGLESARRWVRQPERIAEAADKALDADPNAVGNDVVSVLGVQRPAQIVNYRRSAPPRRPAAGLAAGAIVALGLTLAASVRRRRRDLALLKTLGFMQRQLASAVACRQRSCGDGHHRGGSPRHCRRPRALDAVRPQHRRRS